MRNMIILLIAAAALAFPVSAEMSASEILKKIDLQESFRSNYAVMKQIITTSGGSKRTLEMKAWAVNNGDRQLSEYLSPPDVRGQKILMTDDGDNIWMYNAETRRTRKLGSSMKSKKVMGSDFTYEDQNMGNISTKYSAVLKGTENFGGAECYVLELKPLPNGPSYSKIVIWVGKTDFITRKIDFYEKGGTSPFKRLVMEDIRKAGSKNVPFKMTMRNLQENTETVTIITEIKYDINIPDSYFKSSALGR
ncbi:MAG: outer membrane lipoprotein-sorting protein [Spirochaetes bacterium]|nr:outer membrane lipoprotein-sorting protein [Spirochaetota bacterium]